MKINPNIKKEDLMNLLKNLAIKSFENAEELLFESKLLLEHKRFERAFFLSQIGVEEIGKHIICSSGFVHSHNDEFNIQKFNKKFNSHLEKHSMLNFFEDTRFNNSDSIKSKKFESDAKFMDRSKMMSLYSDFIDDYAFKPSECSLQLSAISAIDLLEKRVSWFKSIGIIEYLRKDASIIIGNLESIPAKQPFIDLVLTILSMKVRNENTSQEEAQIDLMVYKLYELTYDEVLIIEPDFAMSGEEYEQFEAEG